MTTLKKGVTAGRWRRSSDRRGGAAGLGAARVGPDPRRRPNGRANQQLGGENMRGVPGMVFFSGALYRNVG